MSERTVTGWIRHWIDERWFSAACFIADHMPRWVGRQYVVSLVADAATRNGKRPNQVTATDLYEAVEQRGDTRW
jgi:hypothetical protein